MAIGVDEIIALFRGDNLSTGYAHSNLIVELCSRASNETKPSVDWVYGIMYPDFENPKESVGPEYRKIIVEGVKLWYRRGCPRIRA